MRSFLFAISLAATLANAAPALKAAVTVPPYLYLLQALGGERIEAVGLVPPGANPHTWEPTPATLKAFSGATLYFTDSSGMDLPWIPRFKAANSQVRIVNFAQGTQWLKGLHHEDEHESGKHNDEESHGAEHHEEELDPHLWSSPKQVIALAPRISAALMAYDTAGIPYYKKRLGDFLTKAYQLDAAFKAFARRHNEAERRFIVFHPSYGYLARDYGLTQLSVEVEGKEPKPADMARLVETAREHGVNVVFVQPQFDKRSAETLAREIKGTVRVTDPLSPEWYTNLSEFLKTLEGR